MMAPYELDNFIVSTNSGLTLDKLYFMQLQIKTQKITSPLPSS